MQAQKVGVVFQGFENVTVQAVASAPAVNDPNWLLLLDRRAGEPAEQDTEVGVVPDDVMRPYTMSGEVGGVVVPMATALDTATLGCRSCVPTSGAAFAVEARRRRRSSLIIAIGPHGNRIDPPYS